MITAAPAGPARWTRLAALGLLMAGLGPLLMFAAGLLWGLDVSEDAGFFLITAAIALVGALLVWKLGTIGKVLGILAAILVAMGLFWTAFGLAAPQSFFDFVPGVLVIPGALLAIVCCIAAIVAGRRGHRSEHAVGGEQRGIRIVLTVVIVLAALSAVLTFTGRATVDEAADMTVVLKDFEFDEESYDFAAGSTVLVRNDDPFLHTFTIEELDIDETLTPGSEALVQIPDQSGDYIVFCQPHSDPNEPDPEDDMAARATIE